MTQGSRAGGSHTEGRRRISVWLEERPPPRRKAPAAGAENVPGLDRELVVGTAVRLLAADGLERFSMRRLAAELGVTAMSVYWYVDSKDDLLELALDAVQGELELPDGDWRQQARRVAHEVRGLLLRHPWVPALLGRCLNVGPRARAYEEGVRGAFVRAGVPEEQADGALAALFSFAYGHGVRETGWNSRIRDGGHRGPYGGRGEHGESVRLVGQRDGQDARERDFGVALDCVIEGLGALAVSRTAGTPPAPPGCPARP